MTRFICSVVLAALMAAGLLAQAPAAGTAAAGEARLLDESQPALGPVAIREYRAQTYFHLVRRASQKTMPEVMKQAYPELIASGEAKVRELEAFRSASLLYSGNLDQIGEAYMKLYQTLMAGGHVPTQEMRQMILYWEDETSDSNVMLLQVGLQ